MPLKISLRKRTWPLNSNEPFLPPLHSTNCARSIYILKSEPNIRETSAYNYIQEDNVAMQYAPYNDWSATLLEEVVNHLNTQR